jgi:hypothetical protein
VYIKHRIFVLSSYFFLKGSKGGKNPEAKEVMPVFPEAQKGRDMGREKEIVTAADRQPGVSTRAYIRPAIERWAKESTLAGKIPM